MLQIAQIAQMVLADGAEVQHQGKMLLSVDKGPKFYMQNCGKLPVPIVLVIALTPYSCPMPVLDTFR
jgi:hypothetical protein